MIIAIGADHRGFALKNSIAEWLKSNGHNVNDFGTQGPDPVDYPDYAITVARAVAKGDAGLGILICGTGIGMSIAANKVHGVRAARVCTAKDAEMARRHNKANVLCFGGDTVDEELAKRIVTAWLEASFEGERHERRVGKITAFEGLKD